MHKEAISKKLADYLIKQGYPDRTKMVIMTILQKENIIYYPGVLQILSKVWYDIVPLDFRYTLNEIRELTLQNKTLKDSIKEYFLEIDLSPMEYLKIYKLLTSAEEYTLSYFKNSSFLKICGYMIAEALKGQQLPDEYKSQILNILQISEDESSKEALICLKEAWPGVKPSLFNITFKEIQNNESMLKGNYVTLNQEFEKAKINPDEFIINMGIVGRARDFACYELCGIEVSRNITNAIIADTLKTSAISNYELEETKELIGEFKSFQEYLELFNEALIFKPNFNRYYPKEFTESSIKLVLTCLNQEGFIKSNFDFDSLFKIDVPSKEACIIWKSKLPQLVFFAKKMWGTSYNDQFNDIVITIFKLDSGKELTKKIVSTALSQLSKTIYRKQVDRYSHIYKILLNISQRLRNIE